MIENYKVVTFTHHQVNVADLGKYQVVGQGEDQIARLNVIKSRLGIKELLYLATCNRVSFIFYTLQKVDYDFLCQLIKLANNRNDEDGMTQLNDDASLYEGIEAIQHVFEVAGSIDSLVVGESEIFHQFRNAYDDAKNNGLIGDNLRLLEKMTVQVAKHIYSHTRINQKPLSIAALAGQALLEHDYNPEAKVVLIGAGETNTLVAKFLHKHKFANLHIYNRNFDKACALASEVEAQAYDLTSLDALEYFDVLITCTGAQSHIITKSLYEELVKKDEQKKILIDLSVPANIDPAIAEEYDVMLITIDHLKALADKNLNFRRQEISIAKVIIEDALKNYEKVYAQRQIEIALSDLPIQVRQVKNKIKEEVFKSRIDSMSDDQKLLLDEILTYMESKCVGIPMKLAKKSI